MSSLLQDLRYGARMLIRSKGFTAVAVLSLALGIGANTAIFSVVDAILLKPLPVHRPGELVLFEWISGPNHMFGSLSGTFNKDDKTGMFTGTSFSYDTFKAFRDRSQTLSSVFAFAELEQLNVNVDGDAQIAYGQVVSGDYYTTLGVPAILGRPLTPDDDRPNADPVAVISYRYWQKRFGMEKDVVGRPININGVTFTIVGVTPRGFEGTLEVGSSEDLTMPISAEPVIRPGGSLVDEPGYWWVQMIGRLKRGSTRDQTRAELEGAFQQSAAEGHLAMQAKEAKLPAAMREAGPDRGEPDVPNLRVLSGSQGLNDARIDYGPSLKILMAVVGLVLLIACANVATLLLSRAAGRQKEIAVRLALGASRWRLIRQLLTESVLLALVGGALGAVLAYWGKDALSNLRPWGGGELDLEFTLDLRVLGFAAAISLLTGILFGIAPALRSTRLDLTPALKDNARSVTGGGLGLSKVLVIVQVALSLLLLIGAGLFVRTLTKLHNVDVGFNARNLLIFRVDPRLSGYKKEQLPDLYQQMVERIESVPGVLRVTLSRHPLLSGSSAIAQAYIEGKPGPTQPMSFREMIRLQRVRANFLDTMEIPIVAGRGFTDADDERVPKVAIINQAMARKYFADESPVGKRFGFESPANSREIEIIGVARDARYSEIRGETPCAVYLPYLQDLQGLGQMTFEVRTGGDPLALVGGIREAVRSVDSNLPLFSLKTQLQQADASLASERLFAGLSSFFGILALLLACVGLYGVMSYSVGRRTNEIGIRMALGAGSGAVLRLVMRESMLMVFIGVLAGLGGALATSRLISSMLFGLAPNDPLTIALAAFVMLSVAALAGYLPARRASLVDPMAALRCDG